MKEIKESSLYTRVKLINKDTFYDLYYKLEKNPKPYESITRKAMLDRILQIYRDEPSKMLKLCTFEQVQLLKKLYSKGGHIVVDYQGNENELANIRKLYELFLLEFDCDTKKISYSMPLEIKEIIGKAFDNFDEKKYQKYDEILYLMKIIMNTYLILKKDELYNLVKKLYPKLVKEDFEYLLNDIFLIDYDYFNTFIENGDEIITYEYVPEFLVHEEPCYFDQPLKQYTRIQMESIYNNKFDISNKRIGRKYNELKEYFEDEEMFQIYLSEIRDTIDATQMLEDVFISIYDISRDDYLFTEPINGTSFYNFLKLSIQLVSSANLWLFRGARFEDIYEEPFFEDDDDKIIRPNFRK